MNKLLCIIIFQIFIISKQLNQFLNCIHTIIKMKIHLKVLCFFVFLLIQNNLSAQQDIQFSQYMLNTLSYNPAYSGLNNYKQDENYFEGIFTHRSQWLGYTPTFDDGGAPTTQFLGLNMPLSKFNSGAGLVVVRDQLGAFTNYEVQLSYAYHVKIAKAKLSIGFRGGLYSQTVDYDKFRALNPDDIFLTQTGNQAEAIYDMAVGAFYQSPKTYLGLSMNHIVPSKFDFGAGIPQEPLSNHFTVVGGYNWEINPDLVVTPNFLLKTDFAEAFSFDVGALGNYQDKFLLGLSYRHQEAAILMVGTNFKVKNDRIIRLMYSLDYVFIGQQGKQPTSHEISVAYLIPIFVKLPSIIRTPRIRH